MADLLHDNLSVGIRQSGDGQRVEFGVTVGGAFFPFGAQRLDTFQRDLAEAQAQAQAQAQPAAPSVGG